MEADVLIAIVKELGAGHATLALVVLLFVMAWRWFNQLIKKIDSHGESINGISTEVQLSQQWQESHEREDDRRFHELRELTQHRRA